MEASNTTLPTTYWLCPLYCFDCDCDSLQLVEGIRISRLELLPARLKDYVRETPDSVTAGPQVANWAILLPHSKKLGSIDLDHIMDLVHESEATMYLEDLVTALRLCHKGTVAPGEVIFMLPSHLSIVFPIYMSEHEASWIWHDSVTYTLSQPDSSKVNQFIRQTHKWRKKVTDLDIAIRRFNSAYSADYENKIIDHMIAFEALYLGHDPELKYRLALRVAFLLGSDEAQREEIFHHIKEAYNIRSDIVHGNKKVEEGELRTIIPITEEYLRQSIRKFLSLLSKGHSLSSLKGLKRRADKKLAGLDKNILSNGTLLATDNLNRD